jgi:opacity protein-like surface antigen
LLWSTIGQRVIFANTLQPFILFLSGTKHVDIEKEDKYNDFRIPFLVLIGISGRFTTKFFSEGGLMGMIRKILNTRFMLITVFAFLTVFASLISPSYGLDLSNLRYGVSIIGGVGEVWHDKPDFTVYGVLPRIDLPLHKYWDLEFEGNYSYWNIESENNFYFAGVDVNLLFKPVQGSWGSLFLLGGAGIGYNSADKSVEQLGDTHVGGILQGGAGIYYNLGGRWALRLEYRFYHLSDPFKSDNGLNSHTALLGVSF